MTCSQAPGMAFPIVSYSDPNSHRGGGWGPLRRAPTQYLDDRGRPGLLRTVLEAQETRGLTRGDDLSRMLPSEVRDWGL